MNVTQAMRDNRSWGSLKHDMKQICGVADSLWSCSISPAAIFMFASGYRGVGGARADLLRGLVCRKRPCTLCRGVGSPVRGHDRAQCSTFCRHGSHVNWAGSNPTALPRRGTRRARQSRSPPPGNHRGRGSFVIIPKPHAIRSIHEFLQWEPVV